MDLEKVKRVFARLPEYLQIRLKARAEEICKESEDTLNEKDIWFLTMRVIHEITYADHAGRDGNWDEFAGNWFTEQMYSDFKEVM